MNRLLRQLQAEDSGRRAEAAWHLGVRRLYQRRLTRRQRDRVLGRLANLAQTDPDPAVRMGCVHAFAWHSGSVDPTPMLLAVSASDPDNEVRGQALEALASRWSTASPSSDRYADVVGAVTKGLESDDPVDRFWALYGVGTMGLQTLRSLVEGLVDDTALGMKPITVGQEAQDVLTVLDGGPWPNHEPT